MSTFPDWLLKYKTKGVYARKTKDGYALYRGHSERVEGKAYPVFKCDEYLGIVTEKDGLKPSKPMVKGPIRVLRFGFYAFVEAYCSKYHRQSKHVAEVDPLLYVRALLFHEGVETQEGYEGSYVSERYPALIIEKQLEQEPLKQLERLKAQIGSTLESRYGPDLPRISALASNVYAVYVNKQWVVSECSEELKFFAQRHAVKLTI